MINPETNCNSGAKVIPGNDKLQSTGTKKTALRDVRNKNGNFQVTHQENLAYVGGKPTSDAVKICGTKRLTPEQPSTSPSQLSLHNNVVNEHIVNARRRFELELGRGRIYNMEKFAEGPKSKPVCEIPQKQTQSRESNTPRVPIASSNNSTSPTMFPYNGPPIPNYVVKYGNNNQPANFHKVSSEPPRSIISESIDERKRTERFIRLQKFLKQCDESYQKDYIQMLLRVSPTELSGHAVELEKRAIQLTFEEGKEMQRMKALNILEKSAPPSISSQTTQLHPSRN